MCLLREAAQSKRHHYTYACTVLSTLFPCVPVQEEEDCVYLTGPPGTGKTLLLILKALQWVRRGHVVHIISTESFSEAATQLMYYQVGGFGWLDFLNITVRPLPPSLLQLLVVVFIKSIKKNHEFILSEFHILAESKLCFEANPNTEEVY